MNVATPEQTAQKFEGLLMDYKQSLHADINVMVSDIIDVRDRLYNITALEIEMHSVFLTRAIQTIYMRAYLYSLAPYKHLSPSFIAILIAIWGVITAVWKAVKFVIDLLHIREILVVIDILQVIWPEFRKRMEQIYKKISEFSTYLGWGADGLSHLINAAQQGINVVGGVLGKGNDWAYIKGADQTVGVLHEISNWTYKLSVNPAEVIADAFTFMSLKPQQELDGWWKDTSEFIEKAATTADTAFQGMQTAINSIQSIQINMPEEVRKHIPQSIWDGLDRADTFINDRIMPSIQILGDALQRVNDIIDAQNQKLSELAQKLAHPGDVLLGVDGLPLIAKLSQESMIDDVASRQFERDAEAARVLIELDLEEFDILDAALSAPTPEPVFLSIEDPARRAITGIVLETNETWFVGDF